MQIQPEESNLRLPLLISPEAPPRAPGPGIGIPGIRWLALVLFLVVSAIQQLSNMPANGIESGIAYYQIRSVQ